MLLQKVLNIVLHCDTRKEEIMFRYAGHEPGNCDLLSPSIIMRSHWVTVVYGYRLVPYRVSTFTFLFVLRVHPRVAFLGLVPYANAKDVINSFKTDSEIFSHVYSGW